MNISFSCILAIAVLLPARLAWCQSIGTMTDPRDGKAYKTIEIGGKVWMAENLGYESPESWCYMNKPDYCKSNGRLYTWDAAMKACPAGWRLPTDANWEALSKLSGGADNAGAKLLHGGSSGFNASLSGIRCEDGQFVNIGTYGDYWTSSSDADGNAYMRYFFVEHRNLYRIGFHKHTARSVRCIKDEPKK